MIPVAAELAEVISSAAPNVTVLDHVPPSPLTPSIYIGWPDLVDFTTGTLGGHVPFDLPVTFCVGLSDARAAQEGMGVLLYGGVPRALERHETTSWHSLQLLNISNTRVLDELLLTDLNISLMINFRKDT